MNIPGWALPVIVLASLAGVSMACSEEQVTGPQESSEVTAGEDSASSAPAETSLKVVTSLTETSEGGQDVIVVLQPVSGDLGAYQGRVVFDAGKAELSEALTSGPGFHVVNTQEAKEGLIRFGAFAARGFGEATRLRLRFAPGAELSPGDLELKMDVAGGVEGDRLPADQVEVGEVKPGFEIPGDPPGVSH